MLCIIFFILWNSLKFSLWPRMWLFLNIPCVFEKVSSLSLRYKVHISVRSPYWLCCCSLVVLAYPYLLFVYTVCSFWEWLVEASQRPHVSVCVTLHPLLFLFSNGSDVVLGVIMAVLFSLSIMAFSIKRCPSLAGIMFSTWILGFLGFLGLGALPLHHPDL